MFELLAGNHLLFLALLLFLGAILGTIRIAGASLGPAAVLFVAMGVTALGRHHGHELLIPEVLGTLGLALFTFMIGIISGPNFFGSLRRGWPVMLSVTVVFVVVALGAALLGRALGLPVPVIAGTFAGALTNTPGLAAASQAVGSADLPAVGYSISYLWGVLGMMLAVAFALRRSGSDTSQDTTLEQVTVRVDTDESLTVGQVLARHAGVVSITRVQHDETLTVVADPEVTLGRGDRVSIVGPAATLDQITRELGHTSSVDIIGDRTFLDSNRIILSTARFAGKTVADLGLGHRFGAQVSRVRRGDVDMIPSAGFTLQLGDRLRVVGPRGQMRAIRSYLGDSERGFSDINPIGLALGLLLGVGIGMIPLPLPTGHFTIGSAAGTLIVGLVFGRCGRIGAMPVSMSTAAAHTLSGLGMLVFLAYAGTRAGTQFAAAVTSSMGWRIALLGLALTCAAAVVLILTARVVHRTGWVQLAGQLGGAQTQPAVLAFANTRTHFDMRVSLGYALVYPVAMVSKILLAQLLVVLG